MQTIEQTARITPFGPIQRSTRPGPFDLIDAPRAADVLPRRSAHDIFALQPALDGRGALPGRPQPAATGRSPAQPDNAYPPAGRLAGWVARACRRAIAAVSSRRR